MPEISVVLTTYNRDNELRRAIKSVLNQTFKDWELIIMDDHSNDGTQKLCEKFVRKDSRIRYIRRESNFGNHPRPKNEGTKAARADLIAYLDDDNEFKKDHLQVLYKYLGKNDVVYGDRWMIDKTGRGMTGVGVRSDFDAAKLGKFNYIDTSDVLVRKNAIEAVGGWDESLLKFADWNLWLRMCKAGFKFLHVPIIITDYTLHPGGNQFKYSNKLDNLGRILPNFEPDACKMWAVKTLYGEAPKLKVAIFTLTMNRLEYTQRMYDSMTKRANYSFDWFVVDNGSNDGSQDWLYGKPKSLISNDINFGISKASNQALEEIGNGYDIIIKVDNDCVFLTDNWLSEIVDLYERQKRILVSPRIEGLRDSPGGVPRTQYGYVGHHFIALAPHLGGICIAAPSQIYEKFRWEEDDFLHGEQDYVFSQYAVSQNYVLAYLENIICEHTDTTSGQEIKYPEYFKNKVRLKQTRYEQS